MRMLVRSLQLAALGLVAGTGLAAQEEDGAEARTTANAVFNEEQATRGEDVFWNICSECHFEEDFGGPFMQSWNGASVKDLLDEIQATMPEDNPGGMPVSQYLDVIAYMFKLSGMPMGEGEMAEADMDAVEIDWRASYDDDADEAAAATDTARVGPPDRR